MSKEFLASFRAQSTMRDRFRSKPRPTSTFNRRTTTDDQVKDVLERIDRGELRAKVSIETGILPGSVYNIVRCYEIRGDQVVRKLGR